MTRGARLPNGPKPLIELHFSAREMQFINLRYGKCLESTAIAKEMNIGTRTVKYYGCIVLVKLGLDGFENRSAVYMSNIKATKMLLRYGFITLED